MSETTREKLHLINKLRSNRTPVKEACQEAKMAIGTYYTATRALKAKARKPMKKLLNITELPTFVPKTGQLFMVYGSPTLLADFAKGMS